MAYCVVCNQTDQFDKTFQSIDTIENGNTLRWRLESVLQEEITDSEWLCATCHLDLTHIENIVNKFKKKYHESCPQQFMINLKSVDSGNALLNSGASLDNFVKLEGGLNGLVPEKQAICSEPNYDEITDNENEQFSDQGDSRRIDGDIIQEDLEIKNESDVESDEKSESDIVNVSSLANVDDDTKEFNVPAENVKQTDMLQELPFKKRIGRPMKTIKLRTVNKSKPGIAPNQSDPDFKPYHYRCRKIKPHEKIDSFICQTCNDSFTKKSQLNRHMRTHGKMPYACRLCSKSFPAAILLKQHRKAHKVNMCTICQVVFQTKHDLKVHLKTHPGVRSYVCKECGHGFTKSNLHAIHMMNIHSYDWPHKCDKCDKGYSFPAKLRMHKTKAHGEGTLQMCLCNLCGAEVLKSSLKNHIKIHSDEVYSCTLCDKSFRQKHSLKLHTRQHTGEETPANHICPVCGKAFELPSELKIHMPMHTGEKRFFCSECNKGFRFRQELKVHTRGHTGEKPFACEVCDKPFTTSSMRGVHMRIHTGERPYLCSICRKTFNSSSHLKRHLRGVHMLPPNQMPKKGGYILTSAG